MMEWSQSQSIEQHKLAVHKPWSVEALFGWLVGVVGGGQQLCGPGDARPTGGGGSGQKSWCEGFSCGANSDLPFWDGTLLAARLSGVLRRVGLAFV